MLSKYNFSTHEYKRDLSVAHGHAGQPQLQPSSHILHIDSTVFLSITLLLYEHLICSDHFQHFFGIFPEVLCACSHGAPGGYPADQNRRNKKCPSVHLCIQGDPICRDFFNLQIVGYDLGGIRLLPGSRGLPAHSSPQRPPPLPECFPEQTAL